MGVIGSVYAVRLAEAGNDVTVLARGRRLAALHSGGLRIRNLFLDEGEETAEIKVADTLAPGTEFDAVLVTVRSGQVMDVLTRLQQEKITARAIVVIGNNLGNLDTQAGLIGNDRFIAGFGSFGGYEKDGIICYLDGRTREKSGVERRSKTRLGIIDASARPALTLLREIFSGAGLPAIASTLRSSVMCSSIY
ncbi:MAG: 2-dehydropantoate 2-reductase N-terminal domain-containing protein [Oscillospiraceae bacterium]|nr:2-dehydropantoate 2-reductase N-terminal domain-containing protein [Oscillospiraceae bacterium]